MVYPGTSKLRGDGPAQTGQVLEGPRHQGRSVVGRRHRLAETFAGVAAVLGLATRPAALAVLVK